MSLSRKLVFAFLAVSMAGVLLAVILARWMTVREFTTLVIEQGQTAFIERAADYYTDNGSWQGVALHFRQSPRPPYQQQPRPADGKAPQQPTFAFTLVDQDGIVVIPGGPYKMHEHLPEEVIAQGEPVQVDGVTVGTVIASGEAPALGPTEDTLPAAHQSGIVLCRRWRCTGGPNFWGFPGPWADPSPAGTHRGHPLIGTG